MRLLLFTFIISLCHGSFASQPVSGILDMADNGTVLVTSTNCQRYRLNSISQDAQKTLKKLSTGDNINGMGNISESECTVDIQTINYVGLRKLIGSWYSDDGVYNIRDFSSLSFYPLTSKLGPKKAAPESIEYRYSLTPSNGREWILFLSDKSTTIFATISIAGNLAFINTYDSETGDIKRKINLTKWRDLQNEVAPSN